MLEQIQAWMDSLPGVVTIQVRTDGQVLMALQRGTVSTVVVRRTFVEAAEACMQQMSCAARRTMR